ncbi:MAG: hypothetical protein RBS80_05555 [Thermoguttaceae bacterium]|nr:hypothetical protein [Thermoguttaceae bacterium]
MATIKISIFSRLHADMKDGIPRERILAALLVLIALGTAGGCGGDSQDHPATYPVTGTVVWAGGQPLGGGVIELRTTEGRPLSAIGMIQADGTFNLTTMSGNRKLTGAVAGTHRVTVIPPAPDTQDVQAVAEPVNLPAPVEVQSEGENTLTIKLPGHASH